MGAFKRSYFLLLVAVFIIPMLNIGSVYHLVYDVVADNDLEWSCVFLPDNGAYFINSIMLMALFSSAMDILRWRQLIHQAWIALTSESWSEIRVRCMYAAYESFGLSSSTARILLNFTITNRSGVLT